MSTEDVVRCAPTEADDGDLLRALRDGDSDAFGELYARHYEVAFKAALRLVRSSTTAEDVVADSFTSLLAAVRAGGGPTSNPRAYLLTTVRRSALAAIQAGSRTRPADPETLDLPHVDDAAIERVHEGAHVRDAFAALPPRWRRVLWYADVHALTPAQVAPLVGSTPNAVSSLLRRARERLRHEYLQNHLRSGEPGCAEHVRRYAAFVRGTLAPRARASVDEHLSGCASCRAALEELEDVNGRIRTLLLPLGLVGALHTGWVSAAPGVPGVLGTVATGVPRPRSSGTSIVRHAARVVRNHLGTVLLTGAVALAGLAVVAAFALAGSDEAAEGPPQVGDPVRGTVSPRAADELPAPTIPDPPTSDDGPASDGAPGLPDADLTEPGADDRTDSERPDEVREGETTVSPRDAEAGVGEPVDVPRNPVEPHRPEVPTPPEPSAPAEPSEPEPPAPPVPEDPVELDVSVLPLGDLVRGRSGIVGIAMSNADDRPSTALTATIDLPSGVVLDDSGEARAATDWACVGGPGSVTCIAAGVAAGATSHVLLPVAVDATSETGEAGVEVTVDEGEVRAAHHEGTIAVRADGLAVRYAATGAVDVAVVGAPSLHCPATSPRCAEVVAGTATGPYADNNVWQMVRVDEAELGSTSSSAVLEDTGDVLAARLYWSGTCTSEPGPVRLFTPDGTSSTVAATDVGRVGAAYQASADVTEALRRGGQGRWTVADVCVTPGFGEYGGWSLVVLHAGGDPSSGTPDGGDRLAVVLDGLADVAAARPVTVTTAGLAGTQARVGVVAWEGDTATTGDRVSVSGRPLAPRRWDGTGPAGLGNADNALDSTAWGSRVANSLGVDAKDLEPVRLDDPLVEVRATTGADRFYLGAVTVVSGYPSSPPG